MSFRSQTKSICMQSAVFLSIIFTSPPTFASQVFQIPNHPSWNRDQVPEHRKQEFVEIVDQVITIFQPIAALYGANITREFYWDSSGSGAFTLRRRGGTNWHIYLYDGILRFHYATDDLLRSVICHEIGHHIAGYPFKWNRWASAEGQADYFVMHACLEEVWKNIDEEPYIPQTDKLHPFLKLACEKQYELGPRRSLCYRKAIVLEAVRLYEGSNRRPPNFDTPDRSTVETTNLKHPKPQCRLDTHIAGMLCSKTFDFNHFPGHLGHGQNTPDARQDSKQYICAEGEGYLTGNRPLCWYSPTHTD